MLFNKHLCQTYTACCGKVQSWVGLYTHSQICIFEVEYIPQNQHLFQKYWADFEILLTNLLEGFAGIIVQMATKLIHKWARNQGLKSEEGGKFYWKNDSTAKDDVSKTLWTRNLSF